MRGTALLQWGGSQSPDAAGACCNSARTREWATRDQNLSAYQNRPITGFQRRLGSGARFLHTAKIPVTPLVRTLEMHCPKWQIKSILMVP
jgi:hypothetical protein